jgi:hypothetical protein
MRVDLHINGRPFKQWVFEHADYHEPFCQVGFDEKEKLWKQIIDTCKWKVKPIMSRYPYEMYVTVPARIQPADIDQEEQEQFEKLIIEKLNSEL